MTRYEGRQRIGRVGRKYGRGGLGGWVIELQLSQEHLKEEKTSKWNGNDNVWTRDLNLVITGTTLRGPE